MGEYVMRFGPQAAVDRKNALTDRAVGLTRRIMDYVGIDRTASERQEGRLVGTGVLGSDDGKIVAEVIRSEPMSKALAGDGSGVRIVEERDTYHVKRPWVPSFLGSIAYKQTAFSVFYTEPVSATPAEDSAELAAKEVTPRLYAGHVTLAASAENIQRGAEAVVGFVAHLREAMVGTCVSWPPPIVESVRELSSGL
jgi:hypothetical protein